MAVKIVDVEAGSYAFHAGVRAGETLLSINGHEINDVLDYRFYETDARVTLRLRGEAGAEREAAVRKPEYASLGLVFDSYLMDEQRRCRNHCVFCFIDQLPPGLRESLYFKDDDARLSFLFGNYITLTNLTQKEVDRIKAMHISPVNISVHTTNPALRVKMMRNRFAGQTLDFLYQLARFGTKINCQLVLCPGLNDGPELLRTLKDLEGLQPAVQSIAVVPVGLTKYRQGLYPLEPYTKETAAAVIDMVETFGAHCLERFGARLAYAADEFYLKAGRPIPEPAFYGEFAQLENGVGLIASLREEFAFAMEERKLSALRRPRSVSLATGVSAAPVLTGLLDALAKTCDNLQYTVYPVVNRFFGESINVAGLVTGGDLIAQLRGKPLGEELLIPAVMLRSGDPVFLDDVTVEEVSQTLGVPVRAVPNDGEALLQAVLGEF